MEKLNFENFRDYVKDKYHPILNRDDIVLEDLYNVHSDVIKYIEGNWRLKINFDQLCELLEQEIVYYNLVVKELNKRGISVAPKVADTAEFFKINFTYMALYGVTTELTPNEVEVNKVIDEFTPQFIMVKGNTYAREYFGYLLNNPNYSRMFIS